LSSSSSALDDGGDYEEAPPPFDSSLSSLFSGRRRRLRDAAVLPIPPHSLRLELLRFVKDKDGTTLAGARLRRGRDNDGRRIGIALMVEEC
ncbi:hypothetical protein LINGRAHAP2_LOCUS4116, partial [Linum grandiflorum]